MESIWQFAQGLWHQLRLRQALMRFQGEFQQPACLLLALMWLVAHELAPTAALLRALRDEAEQWEREKMAPLRRLVRDTRAEPDQADWHQALLRAQLEGEKVLLARLQGLIEAQLLASKSVSLDGLVLQALPEIGFCEGQTQLLAELVEAWSARHRPGSD